VVRVGAVLATAAVVAAAGAVVTLAPGVVRRRDGGAPERLAPLAHAAGARRQHDPRRDPRRTNHRWPPAGSWSPRSPTIRRSMRGCLLPWQLATGQVAVAVCASVGAGARAWD